MKILIIDNGPIDNRGCQAILTSTCQGVLAYQRNVAIDVCSFYKTRKQASNQTIWLKKYKDAHNIVLSEFITANKLSLFIIKLLSKFSFKLSASYFTRKIKFKKYDRIFMVGGDNFTLDYGFPLLHLLILIALQDVANRTILWGASIGPFNNSDPKSRIIIDSLRNLRQINVRESLSYRYLESLGLYNIKKHPDPAFALKKTDYILIPAGKEMKVGINLSPLYKMNIEKQNQNILNIFVNFVTTELRECTLILIPHVFNPGNDDRSVNQELFSLLPSDLQNRTIIINDELDCQELKGIISTLDFFIGARTHATIAALSEGIPTIMLSYSMKADGLAEDFLKEWPQLLIPKSELSTTRLCNAYKTMNAYTREIQESLKKSQINILKQLEICYKEALS
jgi:polysaccharide pyruvyl transferase WcaK-like protein